MADTAAVDQNNAAVASLSTCRESYQDPLLLDNSQDVGGTEIDMNMSFARGMSKFAHH
jgi:hypothetical protein